MIGFGQQQKKFDLLFLEEGEQYIKDFIGTVRYHDTSTSQKKESPAIIHFCSRSLIIEIVGDVSQPLYKYLFKFFAHEPTLVSDSLPLQVSVVKLIEVPA
mmetsp:Transcript_21956/g.21156  ORF Transcript_21956/g.21156 Transcript_21956/m.21156 type:complete len:100 (+) Transcript_21956:3-302(+)